MSLFFAKRRRGKSASFTLVEMLTVILIIAILMAITIMASEGVLNMAARSRARAEIAAMGSALDNYKTDNGAYPTNDMGSSTNYATACLDPTAANYVDASQNLFQSLTGLTNFTDTPTTVTSTNYISFKANQVSGLTNTGVQDPFGYAYGYNTNSPLNGEGFFDLWSTGGAISTTTNPMSNWLSNWSQ